VQGDPRLVVTISDHSNTSGAAINRHLLLCRFATPGATVEQSHDYAGARTEAG
jgi:hypothetical protein